MKHRHSHLKSDKYFLGPRYVPPRAGGVDAWVVMG